MIFIVVRKTEEMSKFPGTVKRLSKKNQEILRNGRNFEPTKFNKQTLKLLNYKIFKYLLLHVQEGCFLSAYTNYSKKVFYI